MLLLQKTSLLSQHPPSDSQPSLTQMPGELTASSDLCGHQTHMCCTRRQNAHAHRIKSLFFRVFLQDIFKMCSPSVRADRIPRAAVQWLSPDSLEQLSLIPRSSCFLSPLWHLTKCSDEGQGPCSFQRWHKRTLSWAVVPTRASWASSWSVSTSSFRCSALLL